MTRPWLGELSRALLFLGAGGGAGVFLGQPVHGLAAGLALYTLRHVYHLAALYRWFRQRRKSPLPAAHGVWGEVFHHIDRLQQRNKKRKKKLTQYLKRFRQSTEAMPDATVVLDEEGAIEWFNSAAGRLLGLAHPHDVGQRIGNLVRHPDFLSYMREGSEEEAVEFDSPQDPEMRLSVRIINYGKNKRLLIARDVTLLHRLETIRRDFVANVSHELKTPLTVITGYVEAMMDAEGEYPHHWRRSLGTMQQQAARMARLLEDLLLLSRLETTDLGEADHQTVYVPALVASMEEDARLVCGEGLTIAVEADPTLRIRGSGEELRSAFSNLVQNAVRYTPDGGTITVRWFADEGGAHFQVADTGIGIPPQHLSRLTERFYRVDKGRSTELGGTGLGLAIVKHVLNRHEAGLAIDSEPGVGSTFTCTFPPARVERTAGDGGAGPALYIASSQ